MDLYRKRFFIVFLIVRSCASQSTSTALCSTCSAAPLCAGCNVNADVLTTNSTYWDYGNPAIGTPMLQAYLDFTAYSVTSTSSVAGNCITYTSPPVPMIDGYSVLVDVNKIFFENITASESAPLPTPYKRFLDDAYSSFYEVVGCEGCTATLPPSPLYPTYNQLAAAASATALPSASPTEDSVPVRHVHSPQIIIISVVVPSAGLMILLLCFIVIRRYRKKRSHATSTNQPGMTSDTHLYVDQKAELEDEDRRKQELHGEGMRYEMEGEDRIFEMPGNGSTRMDLASYNKTHELRGAEHSKELEVPGNK